MHCSYTICGLQDPKVQKLFKKIAGLRLEWAKWAIEDVNHSYDPENVPDDMEADCFEAVDGTDPPKSEPKAMYRHKPSTASLASEASVPPAPLDRAKSEDDLLANVSMTAEQKAEIDAIMRQIAELKCSESREFRPQFHSLHLRFAIYI